MSGPRVRVFVLGMAVLDHVFHVGDMPGSAAKYRADGYQATVGGGAANAAAAIVRLGGEARLAARLSDDGTSEQILAAAADLGIDTSLCRRTAGATASVSSGLVDSDGERQIMNFRGAGLDHSADWLSRTSLEGCAAVLVDTRWPNAAARALALAGDAGIPGVVDAEPPFEGAEAVLEAASHIAFPAEGARIVTGRTALADTARGVMDRFGQWTAVTDGGNGVYFSSGGDIAHQPANPVEVVDSLGAGDVWHGAFALALAEGRSEAEAVRFASAAAALKCANGTGWDAIPQREDVMDLLDR